MDERTVRIADLPAAPTGWARRFPIFESFQFRDFRWLWLGACASFMSMSMQMTTRAWLVLEITRDSPLALTWTMVSFAAPLTFVSLIAGALADRIPRRHLVILSQAGNAALTLLLAGLDMMGVVQLWHLIILGLCNGSLMALNMPSRQAMISQVVPEGKLRNAISLGTAAMNVTAMAGPAAAGFLIVLVDTHGTFFAIAGFYAFSAASVAMVNAGRTAMARSDKSIVGDIKEGLAYALGNRTLRGLIMVVFLAVIFGSAYWPLLAAWGREVLDVGADGLGILNSAMGVGALAGSLLLASMTGFKRSGLLLLLVCVGWGITLAVFARTVSFAQALPTLVLVGLLSAIFMSLRSTLLQTHSSAEMRGRVVSIGMMSWGLMPLGAVPFGVIAAAYDTAFALMLSGILLAVSTVIFWVLYPSFRRVE